MNIVGQMVHLSDYPESHHVRAQGLGAFHDHSCLFPLPFNVLLMLAEVR